MNSAPAANKGMIWLVLAIMAIVVTTPAARAQEEQALGPIPPPVSFAKAKQLTETPNGWSDFLARLPARPGAHAATGGNRVETLSSGTWTNVTNNAGINPNGGVCNPLLLTDGSVLIHDCDEPDWWKLTPDINGNYATGTWTQVASMPKIGGTQYAPLYNASAVLPDGRVIVEGGEYNDSDTATWVSYGAIYDPLANAWTAVAEPAGWPAGGSETNPGIGDASSIVLSDGTWMLSACCADPDVDALLNPSTLKYTATGAPSHGGSYQDEQGYELLPNGEVLTIDIWTDYYSNTDKAKNPTNTELYVPGSGTWSVGANTPVSLVDPVLCGNFEIGPAAMRPDGTLVAFGGNSGCAAAAGAPPSYTEALDPTAIYDVANNTWTAGPHLPATCTADASAGFPAKACTMADAPAAVLPDGNILFAGSSGYGDPGTHFFEFSSATSTPKNSITQVSDPLENASTNPVYAYNLMVLPNGQILMTDFSDQPEVYTQNTAGGESFDPNWTPTITSMPTAIYAGATYAISGTQFNGLTQGGYYGDDDQSATNYPLVQLQNSETNHVFYGRTFGHSTMSIAPGTAGSTNFTVPAHVETGPNNFLSVIANGIPSSGDSVVVARAGYAKGPDFNANGASDILWRNANGDVEVWLMDGATATTKNNLGNLSNAWSIAGTGDFNGDGTSDILFRGNGGALLVWFMNKSGTIASRSTALGSMPNTWSIAGTGDFNGNGTSDILWWDYATGAVQVWFMSGGTAATKTTIGSMPLTWTIVGTGDFNGDGVSDILWRNNSTGGLEVWFMNKSGSVNTKGTLGGLSNAWTVAGTGDFNGDGVTDIVWHETDGTVQIWSMSKSGTVSTRANVGKLPTAWSIAGTGNFNAGKTTDIVWRDYVSGGNTIWFMKAGKVSSTGNPGALPVAWTLIQ
jgi:hypothetical protein